MPTVIGGQRQGIARSDKSLSEVLGDDRRHRRIKRAVEQRDPQVGASAMCCEQGIQVCVLCLEPVRQRVRSSYSTKARTSAEMSPLRQRTWAGGPSWSTA